MLTRHLYSHDEVIASAIWRLRCKDTREAAFWVKEMIDSEMFDEIHEVLYKSWIWYFGIERLEVLHQIHRIFHADHETTEEEILSLVIGMCSLQQDASVSALLIIGAADSISKTQFDHFHTVPKLAAFFDKEVCSELEISALSSLWQGKIRLGWWFLRSLWLQNADRVWLLLDKMADIQFGSNPHLRKTLTLLKENTVCTWSSRAAAVCCFSLNKKSLKKSESSFMRLIWPDCIAEEIQSWRSLEGKRKRRVYTIPSSALYWLTKRGQMCQTQSNLRKLYCGKWQDLRGIPFWERVLAEEEPWLDDDHLEQFWDTYFPDDIPDEWSLADQQKSHGSGVLIGDEKINFSRFSETWLTSLESKSIWMGVEKALSVITLRDDWLAGWDTIYEVDPEQDLDLEPKTVVLVT